ncbi:hypothetical protein HZU40_30205 [Mycolicibacterium fluoranthenivorans]|uniref:DUF4239 domain-containing protein n=1 Tax=Mycolicibacterium fluoranthenivorans TaxID=258505 RepID=A0A7G8PDG0_9MYCO|nr:hypothetical protein [Mycolicibacterium fluoranthenivorans]QNJ92376.1 hypothetical protein HZU40_30205 [Mycolicibacterium fluoranthenivorans]
MVAWLVEHIPAGLLLLILIAVIAGGAILLLKVIRHRYPALNQDEHNDVTRFTYGVIGFVYAFFIGFVVSSMWGQINTADGNARAEGAAAVQMATDATVFAAADRDRVRTALLTYENAAIAEWSAGDNQRSAAADRALVELRTAYAQVQATTDAQKTFLSTSFGNLDKIAQARTVRILQARNDDGPPWPLWAVIFITSTMVLGAAIVYGVERPVMHYPMVLIVAVLVATNLFLVLELAHPFVGDIATSPDPLHEVVQVLTEPPS